MKICIFERSNEKNYFSKTKINFYKKTTPQLLEHIGLQNMKVGEKTNFGRLATIFQISSSLKKKLLNTSDTKLVENGDTYNINENDINSSYINSLTPRLKFLILLAFNCTILTMFVQRI